MSASDSLLLLLAIASALIWLICTCLHVYHLIRFFQIEEYKSNRFLAVLWRLHPERRFILIVLAVVILLLLLLIPLSTQTNESTFSPLPLIISVIAAILMLTLRPRDMDVKRPFNPTHRARRLLIVALALPVLLTIIALIPFPIIIFFVHLAGALILLFAPLYLPLANLILFPYEEAVRRYYLRLAQRNLERSGATVIALTGSYGKTSTKHYLQHILSGKFNTLMTPKSYNTLLGISRVINEIMAGDMQYDYFLVEAGAYIPGEIARICKLVNPQISIVVAVGPMHLERFGSLENVVKAKYEIIEALPQDGVGVFNADDPNVLSMAKRGYPQTRLLITQQNADGARLSASNVQMTAEGMNFTVRDNATNESRDFSIPLYGEHNVTNVLLAIAVARQLGMTFNEIAPQLVSLRPAEHRLVRTILPNGIILIDDAYSANPVGTQMALRALAAQGSTNRVVVSSGMFELGALHESENHKLGERIAAVATDVILIGSAQTIPVKDGLLSASFPTDHLHVVDNLNDAIAIYQQILHPGDTLLLLTDLPDTYA
ncbi:MAG: UDP-N-acetylmuramoyl-tripeptide--D-alanyl-D-alanine ligase [Anaerolineae bacterium]|nr:UDP-N-acetylmuramoyl-tripeptide--D-alanyl-D-alanine ligase [Anaerolineae bacterium]